MLTLSAVLIGALTTLGSAAASEGAKKVTTDAYEALKRVVQNKLGPSHPAPQLIDEVKGLPPDGLSRQTILEKLDSFKLESDPGIARAMEALAQANAGTVVDARGSSGTIVADTFQGVVTNHGEVNQTFNNNN
ncbi:hypothetical protein [Paraburkholderia terrae]